MIPLRIRCFWRIRLWYALGIFLCLCALGPVPTGYGQAKDVSRKTNRISQLISQLTDPNSEVRRSAAFALREIKDPRALEPLIDGLISQLKNPDADVRCHAATALGEIKDPRAVEPLVDALKDPEYRVRESAAYALGEIKGPRAVEALSATLRSGSDMSDAAASALGRMGPLAIEPLIAALNDSNRNSRRHAASALGGIKDPQVVEPLIAALRDPEPSVREKVAEALGEIGDRRAVGPLISELSNPLGSDPNNLVRDSVLSALCKIGTPAFEAMIAGLSDSHSSTRMGAAYTLAAISSDRFFPCGSYRPRVVEPLIAALKDSDVNIRKMAAYGLGETPTSLAVEPLIAALKDPDVNVRIYAVHALGSIKDHRAIEPLSAALSDANPEIRLRAAEALVEMNAPITASALPAALRKRFTQVVAEYYVFFIGVGAADSEDDLIAALAEFGSKDMAETFLNCGNEKLEQAARAWASSHGFQIAPGKGKHAAWGSVGPVIDPAWTNSR